MITAPRLYAVVDRGPVSTRPIGPLRERKHAELKGKAAIDRAHTLLNRLEARVAAYKSQLAELQKRKALAEARIERLEDEILTRMQEAQLASAPGFHVTFTARPAPAALEVLDEAAIPEKYIRTKEISAPDKNAIKAALSAGVEIAGVRLTQKLTLQRLVGK